MSIRLMQSGLDSQASTYILFIFALFLCLVLFLGQKQSEVSVLNVNSKYFPCALGTMCIWWQIIIISPAVINIIEIYELILETTAGAAHIVLTIKKWTSVKF